MRPVYALAITKLVTNLALPPPDENVYLHKGTTLGTPIFSAAPPPHQSDRTSLQIFRLVILSAAKNPRISPFVEYPLPERQGLSPSVFLDRFPALRWYASRHRGVLTAMLPVRPRFALSVLLGYILIPAATAQTTPKACPAPPAILTPTQPNIFSEQQEQWLGDAMADMIESEYRPVQDPAESAYLAGITKRLLAALPHTTIQFRAILVDSPEINGFSLAGGRVYLTRKLVSNTKNEDEVASVIAHEMGHILSHQFAVETTADFKRLLNVTSVTDKADIYAKFQRLVDASMKDKHPSKGGDSDQGQDEADTVAVYAAAAAGYRPQAYSEFWDRMFFVDGKVGGPLSDFFGVTKPEQKRLRSILKLIAALPAGCGSTQPTASPKFQKWHALVVANQPTKFALDFKPVSEVTLDPPLRMDLERLRFSRDGKYIMAQDETSISILSRDPYQLLFRFDAEDALPAEFSPDSQRIVFHTAGLHTEEWSVPDQKLIASHEPMSRHDCIQTKFAPDGRTLVCLSIREDLVYDGPPTADLTLLDPATGDTLYQKKGFFQTNYDFLLALATSRISSQPSDILLSSFSADGNTLLIGPGNQKLAFDLHTRSPIVIRGDLKNIVNGAYTFLGSDRVLGVNLADPKYSGIFSFPDGKRLQSVPIRLVNLDSVTNGNYVLSSSLENYAIGVIDLATAKFVSASRTPALDIWNGWVVNENTDGGVLLAKLVNDGTPHQSAPLPLSPLGGRQRTAVSADGRLLALSTRTRAGVFDLTTGRRLLLTRQFNSAVFSPDNTLYEEMPKIDKQERGIWHFTIAPAAASAATYKEDDNTYLSEGILQEWKGSEKKPVDLIVHDVRDNSVLWRRTFPDGQPAHTYNFIPGQTIFSFPLKEENAKEVLKSEPALAAQANAIKNKNGGRIIQIVDNATGKVVQQTVLEVPLTYEGVAGINIVGPNLYLTSDDNRTMVYNFAAGTQLRQIFGFVVALDAKSGRVCMVNRRDEAAVYDPAGDQVASFRTGSPLRFATFHQDGNQLVLLTADQKIRTMEISATPALATASSTPPPSGSAAPTP
jgi:hypothetical protein